MGKKIRFIFIGLLLFILLCFSACTMGEKVSEKNSVIMGSVVNVKTFGENEQTNSTLQSAVLDAISQLDMVISKNNENAELYKINHSSQNTTAASDELIGYIKETKDIYSFSQGIAGISSGALTELWGIDTEDFRLPTQDEINSSLLLCDDSKITFNDDNTIQLSDGQVINLGSVGKGIACDKAVETIKNLDKINGAVISVGGSIATVGTHDGKSVWNVGVRNPFGNESTYFATLKLNEAFVSTSGSYEKRFEVNGKAYHHILDLTTGYPVENGLCSVTVVAPSGLLSDALSTMCFLLGQEKSLPILEKYNSGAVFVYENKTVYVTESLKDIFSVTDNAFSLV